MKRYLKLYLLLINSFICSDFLKDIKNDGVLMEFSGYLMKKFDSLAVGVPFGYQINENQYDILNTYIAKNNSLQTVLTGFVFYKEFMNFFIEKLLIGINLGFSKYNNIESFFCIRVSFVEISINSVLDVFDLSFVSVNIKLGFISETGNFLNERSFYISILGGLNVFYKIDGYNLLVGGSFKYGGNLKYLTNSNIKIIKEAKKNSINNFTNEAKDLQENKYKCNQINKIHKSFFNFKSEKYDTFLGLDISDSGIVYGIMPVLDDFKYIAFDDCLSKIKENSNEFFILRNGGLINGGLIKNEMKLKEDSDRYFDKLTKGNEKNKKIFMDLFNLRMFMLNVSYNNNDLVNVNFKNFLIKIVLLVKIEYTNFVFEGFKSFELIELHSNEKEMLQFILNLNDDNNVRGIHLEFLLSLHNSLLEKLDLCRFKYFNLIDSVFNKMKDDKIIDNFR